MLRTALSLATFCAFGISAAIAQCAANFRQEGVPLITGITYRTSAVVPLPPGPALQALAKAVSAEGFHGIRVNSSLGAISAFQETTGFGDPQTLRVVARKAGKGSRVDAVFAIQPGQVTSGDLVRDALCRIIESVG